MKLDQTTKKSIKKLSEKYKLEENIINSIVESPFIFIRKTISSIDFENVQTEEQFLDKALNFNIPCIGKMYGNIYNFKRLKKNESTTIK